MSNNRRRSYRYCIIP